MLFKVLLLAVFAIPVVGFSQILEDLPLNESGKISYSEIVTVEGVKKDELFLRAKTVQQNFKIKEQGYIKDILLEDKEEGVMIYSGVYILLGQNMRVDFKLKIQVKDNKYKYELFEFVFTYPFDKRQEEAEFVFDKKNYYRSNGKVYSYKIELKDSMKEQFEDMKGILAQQMSSNAVTKSDW